MVLAAGEGTRMRSTRPKPLHLLCGKAMLLYVLDALSDCDVKRAVVVVATSDQPALVRKRAAFVATRIAEWFRDQGIQVNEVDKAAFQAAVEPILTDESKVPYTIDHYKRMQALAN